MTPRPLEPNVASLHLVVPGAATPVHWNTRGDIGKVPELADNNRSAPARILRGGEAVGIELDDPIFHGLAISLLFGIFVSTVLTLLVIPVLYYAANYRRIAAAPVAQPAIQSA